MSWKNSCTGNKKFPEVFVYTPILEASGRDPFTVCKALMFELTKEVQLCDHVCDTWEDISIGHQREHWWKSPEICWCDPASQHMNLRNHLLQSKAKGILTWRSGPSRTTLNLPHDIRAMCQYTFMWLMFTLYANLWRNFDLWVWSLNDYWKNWTTPPTLKNRLCHSTTHFWGTFLKVILTRF